ncbi:MAG: DUF4097 family beta strand repeat-containing protein [Lachnospiraceae bacterium]|nr:DUF4097 family beta strand repeat-containing protein [Lachnospiraceae bacterium]
MKLVKKLFLAAVILFALGEILIAVSMFTQSDERDRLNANYTSTMVNVDEKITNLIIEATGADVDIDYGDSLMVSLNDVYRDGLECTIENGSLKIVQKDPAVINLLGWEIPGSVVGVSSEHSSRITVILPPDLVLDNTTVNVGSGDVTIDNLNSRRVVTQVGMGNLTVQNVKSLEKYAYQVAVGVKDVRWE